MSIYWLLVWAPVFVYGHCPAPVLHDKLLRIDVHDVAGSMVSFAMRLLHADLPHLNGRSQETLDRLYYILAVVRKVRRNWLAVIFKFLLLTQIHNFIQKIHHWTTDQKEMSGKKNSCHRGHPSLKGILNKDLSWLEKVENVQIFHFANLIWWFCLHRQWFVRWRWHCCVVCGRLWYAFSLSRWSPA